MKSATALDWHLGDWIDALGRARWVGATLQRRTLMAQKALKNAERPTASAAALMDASADGSRRQDANNAVALSVKSAQSG